MRFILLIIILLANCLYSNAQGLSPSSMTCLEPFVYMHPTFPGSYSIKREFSSNSCVVFNEPTVTGNLITEGKTNVIAGQSIHIMENMHINFSSDLDVFVGPGESNRPEFHAFIGNSDFDVFWYEPNSTVGTVGKYEKLELGLRIPSTLKTSIDNFVNNAVTSDKLNPFDPADVNVEAQFYFLDDVFSSIGGTIDKKVNGFYYKEYFTPAPTDLDWVETDTVTFPFRIRFAPDKVGNWVVKIKIITPSGTLEALPVNFYCAPSSNHGFVKKGSGNPQYLSLDGATFFPVGQNLFSPFQTTALPSGEWYEFETKHDFQVKPQGYYDYFDRMQLLKDQGGNYFRFLVAPAATEIEFEKLGDYSQRMDNAWEFDKILDKAKELDLYMHFNMQVHFALENPNGFQMWFWDWTPNTLDLVDPGNLCFPLDHAKPDNGYCYNSIDMDPMSFFSNTISIQNYQNRLRYMVSRWGYSTNIAAMELFSEIDNAGQEIPYEIVNVSGTLMPLAVQGAIVTKPYWQDDATGIANATAIGNWENTMADYIKETLDHDSHLIAVSYTGGTGGADKNERENSIEGSVSYAGPDLVNDAAYSSSNIDIMTYNFYGSGAVRFKDANGQINFRHSFDGNKPFMFSEIGADSEGCDNDVEWLREAWISPFLGCAGMGSHWSFQYLHTDIWDYFGMIKDFLSESEYNFANEEWTAVYDERSDHKSEVYALVSENKNKCVGVIVNRTVNFFTVNDEIGTYCVSTANATSSGILSTSGATGIEELAEIGYNDSGTDELKIDLEPGDYHIEYISGITGGFAGSDDQLVGLGQLNLRHPQDLRPPESSSGFETWLMPFKAYKNSTKNLSFSSDSSVNLTNAKISFEIVPNPASDMISVLLSDLNEEKSLKIYSSNGQLVFVSGIKATKTDVNIQDFNNGIYTAVITSKEGVSSKKFIIQHGK